MSTSSTPLTEIMQHMGLTPPPTDGAWIQQTLKALDEQHPGWDFTHFIRPDGVRWEATHRLSGERRISESLNTVLKLIEITDATYAKVRGEEA